MAKPFENNTTEGNEPAIRRGRVVPEDAVNLAYVHAPKLNPRDNVVIVDTSHIVEENAVDTSERRKIMYANALGVLEDEHGNQLIDEEFPAVTDVFSIAEDYSMNTGSEYKPQHVLPFVHESRYFHIDWAGLTIGSGLFEYSSDKIKIVDKRGRRFVDADGNLRYKIQIVAAYMPNLQSENQAVYRVHAYVDSDVEEELYLMYNKVEVSPQGVIRDHVVNHKELINQQKIFEYRPEESEVVDPVNVRERWYSSKPVSLKEQVLGLPFPSVDGYKIYVPRKAIADPRIFQLFHWRATATFTQPFTVDTSDSQVIRCGVVTTGNDTIPNTGSYDAAYALLNLQNSAFNANDLVFENPLHDYEAASDRNEADYWFVNLDTITQEELGRFDFLIWTPGTPSFNFAPYTGLIDYFTRQHGGTLFIDTNNYTVIQNLYGIAVTNGVNPGTGAPTTTGGVAGNGSIMSGIQVDETNPLVDGVAQLGGWDLTDGANNDELKSISYITQCLDPGFVQRITATPVGWNKIVRVNQGEDTAIIHGVPRTKPSNAGDQVKTTVDYAGGNIIVSTMGVLRACSALWSHVESPAQLTSSNTGLTLAAVDEYTLNINSTVIEGAMKFLFNAALLAVKGRKLDSTDNRAYSTSWSYSSEWEASWVIKPDDGVLSQEEKDKYDFALLPQDPYGATPSMNLVWKRRLTTKTVQELIDEIIMVDPVLRERQIGAVREYSIEITNGQVGTDTEVSGSSTPYAYTLAYSPRFRVPEELGPHVITSNEIKAAYGTGQYEHITYSDLPYNIQVRMAYAETVEEVTTQKATWTATGVATESWDVTTTIPASVTTSTSEVSLDWWHHPWGGARTFNVGAVDPSGHAYMHRYGYLQANGIQSWQDANYLVTGWGPGHLNFPFWGMTRRLDHGATGEVVKFVQDVLNHFHAVVHFFDSGVGTLALDGVYGSRTKTAILNFQRTFSARFKDGIVDAETWSILGYQIIRSGLRSNGRTDWMRFVDWPYRMIETQHLSDGRADSVYAKRSYTDGGPPVIWDLFAITYGNVGELSANFLIHGVTITPYLEGACDNLMFRSVWVGPHRNLGPPDGTFDSNWSQLNNMPYRVRDNQPFRVNLGPYWGNMIVVGIGQDQPAGPAYGTSRVMGIREIVAHTTVTTSTINPAVTVVTQQSREIPITQTGEIDVHSFHDVVLNIQPKLETTGTRISNIRWTSIALTNSPNISASIRTDGRVILRNIVVTNKIGDNFTHGPELPGGDVYYSMDEDGRINLRPEIGRISKSEGIKLLCDVNGSPHGFPPVPAVTGPNELQRHYVNLSIQGRGNDSNVQASFYDKARQEFVVDAEGRPNMTYIDWVSRGVDNVYIGIVSTYQQSETRIIPTDDDAPKIPQRWAMPVYGLYKSAGARITLEPLPTNLGPDDVWPIAVRDGVFSRSIRIRARAEGEITGYLGGYQGKLVRAYYGIPEADVGGWSTIYGAPNADVVGEHPMIIDDDTLQVRQTPILMVRQPTATPGLADPKRPIFSVYTRASYDSEWELLPWTEIKDYNLSTGEIILKTALTIDDSLLIKVDYTTERRHYHFKKYGDTLLNLNPYPGHSRGLIGKAIHVYIVPEYVRDELQRLIPESVQSTTLRFTTSTNIFDPIRPEYDPLAILLGAVYISTALDIDDLVLLDTRRRGGGARDGANVAEIVRLVTEASTYWDIGYGSGSAYQKGGFVVVRLPEELKGDFTNQEITEIISHNITAGVKFKIEDLNGNEWS